jgi:N-acetylglucosaminyldiphosphoundecaprenol N-acetyl-beta-D-mannosaminyltransferase
VRLLGVPISCVDARQACEYIIQRSLAGIGGWVVTPNLDILRRFVRHADFRELCADADLRLADGMPLVWASRLQGTPLPERVAGSDLIWRLAERAAEAGRSVFLLGGNPGAAANAADVLRERSPSLRIAGVCCPPMGFENDRSYIQSLDRMIVDASPDIVFVGLGSPKQELLIRRLRTVQPRAWYLGVGVSFSFTAGEISRAPVWMRRSGLEWCHRLAKEPGRLWKRYLVQGVPFGIRLLLSSAGSRFVRTLVPARVPAPVVCAKGGKS